MKNTMKNWVKVSLLVKSPAFAETIAGTIASYIPNGVVIEAATPLFCVSGYLPIDNNLEEQKRHIQEEIWRLGQKQPLPEPVFTEIEAEDWATAWQKNYHPYLIGDRLHIIPAWMDLAPDDRVALYIDPQATFGSGSHPTTQTALELLVESLDDAKLKPNTMIDVGCGSGILAIAMAKLGVDTVLALDIDQEAVDTTRVNSTSNGVADKIDVEHGSVSDVLAGTYALSQSPLVCANMLASILQQLLDQGLNEIVSPAGELILAGMLENQAPAIIAELEKRHFLILSRRHRECWVAVRAKRSKTQNG